jgi:hypothetical protein
VLGLRGIRWLAVGEGREWDKLIGGGDSDCRWEAAICESKMGEEKKKKKKKKKKRDEGRGNDEMGKSVFFF